MGPVQASRRPARAGALLGLLFLLAAGGDAAASIKVAGDAHDPVLRVDSAGYAEVDWTASSGERRSLLVSPSGSITYGGRLSGGDVSTPVDVRIPFAIVARRTPDGALWALQSWRRLAHGPVELRFSRWRGEITRLDLRTVCCKWGGENLEGEASYHGKPIFGYRSTPAGVPLDDLGRNVYLDSYQGKEWVRMMGILANRPTGHFTLWIRKHWQGTSYRAAMIGPNWGWTLAPDAQAHTASSMR